MEGADNFDVCKILIGTWHSNMPIGDARWQASAFYPAGGKASFHVSFSEFPNPEGAEFYTNAEVFDSAGNSTFIRCVPVADLGNDFYATLTHTSGGQWEVSGDKIRISEVTESDDPKRIWHFKKQLDGAYAGSYEITSEWNEKCIDIESYGIAGGTPVNLLPRATNAAQRFYIHPEGDRYYFNSVYCLNALDATGPYESTGGVLQMWTSNQTNAQLFSISILADYPGKQAPAAPVLSAVPHGSSVTLSWESPVGEKYDSRLYDVTICTEAGTTVYTKQTDHTGDTVTLENGNYTLNVTAVNTKYQDLSADASITFTVDGSAQSHTITYHGGIPGGGTISNLPETQEFTGTTTISDTIPVCTGSTFSHWQDGLLLATTVYEPGETYSGDADLDLYAVWEGNTYTLYFDPNGGECDVSSKTIKNAVISLYGELPAPTRFGYRFTGWYTKADGGNLIIPDTNIYLTNDETIYAHWEKLQDLVLPEQLGYISDQAFYGSAAESISVPATVAGIGSRAFGNCAQLITVRICASTAEIAPDAFEDHSPELVIYCEENSPAHKLARDKGIHYVLFTTSEE